MIAQFAGYKLRKWISSDPKILEHLPPELKREEDIVSFSDDEPTIKTLGLQWNAVDDCVLFKSHLALIDRFSSIPDKKVTKRALASAAGSIYDPLGLVPFATIVAKLLMVKAWSFPGTWDTSLPTELVEQIRSWLATLPTLTSLKFNCCIRTKNKTVQHQYYMVLTDASPQAVAACIYLCVSYKDDSTTCRLLMAKSRVAPSVKSTDSSGNKVKT